MCSKPEDIFNRIKTMSNSKLRGEAGKKFVENNQKLVESYESIVSSLQHENRNNVDQFPSQTV